MYLYFAIGLQNFGHIDVWAKPLYRNDIQNNSDIAELPTQSLKTLPTVHNMLSPWQRYKNNAVFTSLSLTTRCIQCLEYLSVQCVTLQKSFFVISTK